MRHNEKERLHAPFFYDKIYMRWKHMTITIKVSEKTQQEMSEFFEDFKREKTPAYAKFQADDADTVVTLYESGKAVFQGKDADLSSRFWVEREKY